MRSLAILSFFFFASSAGAASNCRLRTHTLMDDGKKKVRVEEIETATREECRLASIKLQSELEGEGVKSVKVIFGFREARPSSDR